MVVSIDDRTPIQVTNIKTFLPGAASFFLQIPTCCFTIKTISSFPRMRAPYKMYRPEYSEVYLRYPIASSEKAPRTVS